MHSRILSDHQSVIHPSVHLSFIHSLTRLVIKFSFFLLLHTKGPSGLLLLVHIGPVILYSQHLQKQRVWTWCCVCLLCGQEPSLPLPSLNPCWHLFSSLLWSLSSFPSGLSAQATFSLYCLSTAWFFYPSPVFVTMHKYFIYGFICFLSLYPQLAASSTMAGTGMVFVF